MAVGEILATVLVGAAISLPFFCAWYLVAGKLMGTRVPKKRLLAWLGAATGLQVALNLAVLHPFGRQILYGLLGWQALVFSLQGVLLWWMLYRRARLPQAISAVALSYFFFHSLTLMMEALVNYGLTRHLYLGYGIDIYDHMGLVYALNIAEHAATLAIGWLLCRVMDKTRFPVYYANLFEKPRRAWAVAAASLLLMHAFTLTAHLFPALENSIAYYVLAGVSAVGLLLVLLFVAVFESNREKVKAQEDFILQQQVYVQTLEGLQQDLRAFRHDTQNLLSGLYLQAQEGDIDALRQSLCGVLQYFDGRLGDQIRRVTELARIQLPEVKSLLLVKLMQAEEARVPIKLEVPAGVDRLDMHPGDFLRCLGILVDNALEAAPAVPGGEVRVALIQTEQELGLVVANPAPEKPDLARISQPGFSTKGEGRGTGLAGYRAITGRYANVASATRYEQGVFRQELRIRRQA